jgi:hypothetical protein
MCLHHYIRAKYKQSGKLQLSLQYSRGKIDIILRTTEGWTVLKEEEYCENVRIQSISSSGAHDLWNINCIRGSCWYITIKVWNIYNGNIAVVSFVIKAGRKVITGVKFKIIVIFKMTAESSYHLSFTYYIRRKHLNSISITYQHAEYEVHIHSVAISLKLISSKFPIFFY